MKKYRLSYKTFSTEQEAQTFCDIENSRGTTYKKQNKKANFNKWKPQPDSKTYFVAWYYI